MILLNMKSYHASVLPLSFSRSMRYRHGVKLMLEYMFQMSILFALSVMFAGMGVRVAVTFWLRVLLYLSTQSGCVFNESITPVVSLKLYALDDRPFDRFFVQASSKGRL